CRRTPLPPRSVKKPTRRAPPCQSANRSTISFSNRSAVTSRPPWRIAVVHAKRPQPCLELAWRRSTVRSSLRKSRCPACLTAFAVNAELLGLSLHFIKSFKRGLLLFQDFIILRFQFLELLDVFRRLRLLFRILGGSRRCRMQWNRCWLDSLSNTEDGTGKHRQADYEYSECLHHRPPRLE